MKRLYTPLGVLLLAGLLVHGAHAQTADTKSASQLNNARSAMARQATTFIENKGQWDPQARFLARMPGLDLWVTNKGLTYDLFRMKQGDGTAKSGAERTGHVIRMNFEGAAPNAGAEGLDKLAGAFNYFNGNDRSKWATNVPRFSEARINHLYNGVDAALYFDNGLPRYDILLAPGADASAIRIAYEGASGISVSRAGDLVISTSLGDLKQQGLYAYQMVNGVKKQVACAFKIEDGNRVGFELGAYDRTSPLVIDPLIYSTFIGGNGWDEPRAITTDLANKIYIAGYTLSANFPVVSGSYHTGYGGTITGLPPGGDAFVAKIDVTLSPANQLMYATFLGGTDDEVASDVAVDFLGNAYITGVAAGTFPTTNTVTAISGRGIFAAKLNANGSQLIYSTFVTDNAFTAEGGIAIDNLGRAHITGSTTMAGFPASVTAYQTSLGGGADAFVAQLNPAGTTLTYATLLGGNGDDVGTDIALQNDAIFVTGYTSSTNFPLLKSSAYDSTYNGSTDAFVSRLEPAVLTGNTQLTYSTYVGGGNYDAASALAVDSFGYINITGVTSSTDFPLSHAYQTTFGGGAGAEGDAFVLKINPFVLPAQELLYSTYLGGPNADAATDIAIDASRDVYITGWTASPTFPITPNALRKVYGGDSADVFVAKFISTGALSYSTFLNGNAGERANGIAISGNSDINVTGYTRSANFPTSPSAFQSQNSGLEGGPEGFVTRFAILEVKTPNGGEKICANSIDTITWTGGTTTNYDIYISKNSGVTYNAVALNVVGNSFAWPIAASFPPDTNYRIKVVVSNGTEADVSDKNFTINAPPTITLQPISVNQPQGGTATFTAVATGTPAPTVQWEVNTGSAWTAIPGATGTTFKVNGVTAAQNGYQYRAVFTNSCAVVTSDVVTLTVSSIQLVYPNGGESFCAGTAITIVWTAATGTGPYNLAVSKNGGISWQAIATGLTDTSFTWAIPGTFAGREFLVQVTLSNGQAGDISNGNFTINSAPKISKQPLDVTINAGNSASMSVEASGTPIPTVLWQVNTGSGWNALPGTTGTTIAINSAPVLLNGSMYRAIFSNDCGNDTSRAATLTVLAGSGVNDPTTGLGALRLSVAPNPISGVGEISVSLQHATRVQVDIADMSGIVVAHLADTQMGAGDHQVRFDATGLPSGAYVVILTAGTEHRTVKLTVAK